MKALRFVFVALIAMLLVVGCDWFDDIRTRTLTYRLHDFTVDIDSNGGVSETRRLDFSDDPDWDDVEDHLDEIENSDFTAIVSSNDANGAVLVEVVVDADGTQENGNEDSAGILDIDGGTGTWTTSGDNGVLEDAARRGFAYVYLRTGQNADENGRLTVGTLDVSVDAKFEP